MPKNVSRRDSASIWSDAPTDVSSSSRLTSSASRRSTQSSSLGGLTSYRTTRADTSQSRLERISEASISSTCSLPADSRLMRNDRSVIERDSHVKTLASMSARDDRQRSSRGAGETEKRDFFAYTLAAPSVYASGDLGSLLSRFSAFQQNTRGGSRAFWGVPAGSGVVGNAYWPHYAMSTRPFAASTVHGPTLSLKSGSGWNEPGCVVASIATVAKTRYGHARAAAVDVAGFGDGSGLTFTQGKEILDSLGVTSSVHDQVSSWGDLPDLAIISVYGKNGGAHAVVFERNGGNEYIYDWQNARPIRRSAGDYTLLPKDKYLAIH